MLLEDGLFFSVLFVYSPCRDGCSFVDTVMKEKKRAAETPSAEGAQMLGDEAV